MTQIIPALMAVLLYAESTRGASEGPDSTQILRACTAAVLQADGVDVSNEQLIQSVYCSGYVGGVLDGLTVMGWKGGTVKVCIPEDGIDNEQAIRIVVKHLRQHPELLHETARTSIMAAIGLAFQCK